MSKIAVIGMSCLFPGASTPAEFWDNLIHGRDNRLNLSEEQLGVDPMQLYTPHKGVPDHLYSTRNGHITNFTFDPLGFAIAPEKLSGLDSLYQWSLYVAREALADSGYLRSTSLLERTGVILGNLSFPTRESNNLINPLYVDAVESALRELLDVDSFRLPRLPLEKYVSPDNGRISGYPAALVAQALGLSSVYFSLDAACASSLYAVKLACDYLQAGKTDMMLAGAVSCSDPYIVNMSFSVFRALPQENEDSRPLDRHSKGLIASEGAGMLVLKRYEDALRDGDRIYATILATGLSNDGGGKHVLTPNTRGQVAAFERAYQATSVIPQQIDYIECHATGTPLGDETELNSIDEFFIGQGSSPLLGSVKSNLGHLLTAAGMAGLIKVILSIVHGQIPPTIHVETPLSSENGRIIPDQIVRQLTPWTKSHKIAAVNAFGFGGTNAHLILESPDGQSQTILPPPSLSRMAIVGMDTLFAGCNGLTEFEQTIFDGKQHFSGIPPARWQGLETTAGTPISGGFIDSVEFDFLKYKLPPAVDEELLPQQLLVLEVSDRAIMNAQLKRGDNVAVLVAMESDLSLHRFRGRIDLDRQIRHAFEQMGIAPDETLIELAKTSIQEWPGINQHTSYVGNIAASRIAAQWDFSGPAFTVSDEENSVGRALEIAQLLLDRGEVEAVVIGAVDLSAGIESVTFRSRIRTPNSGNPTLGYDANVNGWIPGEGAGAVVLKREDTSIQDRVYAFIDAVYLDNSPEKAVRTALSLAGIEAANVAYLEVDGGGIQDEREYQTLRIVYGKTETALGSIKANIGHTFAAAGMAGLIKATLCIYRRYIPPVPGWSSPKWDWSDVAFDVPVEARPWFTKRDQCRIAAVNTMNLDGQCGHVILSERMEPVRDDRETLRDLPFFLLPLVANSVSELLEQLNQAHQRLDSGDSVEIVVNQAIDRFSQMTEAPLCLVLLGQHRGELVNEMKLAESGCQKAAIEQTEWQTPLGSYFTACPQRGKVAFVYPGAFNAYLGLGRDLFYAFPSLYDRALKKVASPADFFRDHNIYPRGQTASADEFKALSTQFEQDIMAMMESGISFGTLFTGLMRDIFQVKPDGVFGYSMGESTMLYATGVWNPDVAFTQAFRASPLFRQRLLNQNEAAAEFLNVRPTSGFWRTQYLMAPLEQVQAILRNESSVFIASINTPNEVVISGETQAVTRVVQKLQRHSIPISLNFAMHSPASLSEYQALVKIHDQLFQLVQDIEYYSSSTYDRIVIGKTRPNDMVARMITTQLDFPRLVNEVYANGYRVFIELGPGNTCTHWIDTILERRDHVAMPISQKRYSSFQTALRAVSKLASHRVSLNLALLKKRVKPVPERQLMKRIHPGGPRIHEMISNPTTRTQFAALIKTVKQQQSLPISIVAEPARLAAFSVSTSAVTERHIQFLNYHREVLKQYTYLTHQLINTFEVVQSPVTHPPAIWDYNALREFAHGSIANVFGQEYALLDTFRRRVRLPTPPYLLVSRVTQLDAKRGDYEPSTMTTEYDIPFNAWYSVDSQAPWAISVESGQCDLLLISYLGIDFENRGELVYRLLDCTLTFWAELPKEGDTLRYDIKINSFARTGSNLLFFFSYDCFVQERKVLTMTGGCAGFFSDQALQQGQGVITTAREITTRQQIKKRRFISLLEIGRAHV